MYKFQYKHVTNINNRTTQHYIQDTINAFLTIFTLLLSLLTSHRTRATFRTNSFPCPRTINAKDCFKLILVINLQFIFQDGSRGGRFQVFRKAVPQRNNSVEKGISEVVVLQRFGLNELVELKRVRCWVGFLIVSYKHPCV